MTRQKKSGQPVSSETVGCFDSVRISRRLSGIDHSRVYALSEPFLAQLLLRLLEARHCLTLTALHRVTCAGIPPHLCHLIVTTVGILAILHLTTDQERTDSQWLHATWQSMVPSYQLVIHERGYRVSFRDCIHCQCF